jgi:hypothetical protein
LEATVMDSFGYTIFVFVPILVDKI